MLNDLAVFGVLVDSISALSFPYVLFNAKVAYVTFLIVSFLCIVILRVVSNLLQVICVKGRAICRTAGPAAFIVKGILANSSLVARGL